MKDVKTKYKDYLESPAGAGKYHRFKDILYGRRDSLVLELFKIIYPLIKSHKNLAVLDVGGGDGKRLRHLIDLFQKKGIKVEADLVDPSRTFIASLKKDLGKIKYPIRAQRNSFEKFESKRRYDLIILIHSIYTFRDYQYLTKIKNLLEPGGWAVFVVNDADSFLGGLKKITDARFQSSRNEVDALLRGLRQYKYTIRKFDTRFSGVLTDQQLNAKGKLILEWIGMRLLSDIPPETIEKARKFYICRMKKGLIREKEVVVITSFGSK